MHYDENQDSETNRLVGKTVMITGATSGIGRALVLLLVKSGLQVIAHGRSEDRLNALVSSVGGENITTVRGDFKTASGRKAVDSAIKEKQPEILILNAGYNSRKEYVCGWTDGEVMEMLQVNMISPLMSARTFANLPQLPEPRRLAFILSTSCHFPRPKLGLYVAAKMGLMGFGKVMQQEARDLGVITTLFYPGRTNSNFREIPNDEYMPPESVAKTVVSVLNLPQDVVPYEITFRPPVDINI